jgi:hypothetical protein
MEKKRLDVWIQAGIRDYVAQEALREGRPMNALTNDLLAHAIACRRGEMIEQQSLPIIREIIQTELRKTGAQLRSELREDAQLEIVAEIKSLGRRSDDRLAALLVRAIRDAQISRRLVYVLLAKTFGAPFATEAYDNAREKTGQDLAARPSKESAQ